MEPDVAVQQRIIVRERRVKKANTYNQYLENY